MILLQNNRLNSSHKKTSCGRSTISSGIEPVKAQSTRILEYTYPKKKKKNLFVGILYHLIKLTHVEVIILASITKALQV